MPTSSADPPVRPAAPPAQATPGRPEPLLELRQLSAGYNGIPVIEGVTIGVGRAEVVAIIGPNGAGKSTLLKAVIGEIPALAGTVSLGGRDLARLRADRRARLGIGYVPQTRDVFDALTVAENLKMGGYLLDKQELATQTQQVLEVFPVLAGMRDRIAGRLSGGERKMLAVGRTLMLRPSLLILDEPSANLAPDLAKEVLAGHVRRLADTGMGVLLVEQKVFEALDVADWAHVLVAGHPRMEGRPADLLDRPDLRDVFLGADVENADPAVVRPNARGDAGGDPG
jgi:ABC-type branched-subunit amino acid transport system ATPase component